MQGLGARVPAEQLAAIDTRLKLPKGRLSLLEVSPRTAAAAAPVSRGSRAR